MKILQIYNLRTNCTLFPFQSIDINLSSKWKDSSLLTINRAGPLRFTRDDESWPQNWQRYYEARKKTRVFNSESLISILNRSWLSEAILRETPNFYTLFYRGVIIPGYVQRRETSQHDRRDWLFRKNEKNVGSLLLHWQENPATRATRAMQNIRTFPGDWKGGRESAAFGGGLCACDINKP